MYTIVPYSFSGTAALVALEISPVTGEGEKGGPRDSAS
jgi:hypothetical protein